MPNPLSGRRKARANLRDTCQPRGPSRRALADKSVNVRNLSSAPSAHPLEATPPSWPAFLLLRGTRPGRRDRSASGGNAGAGSAAAAECARKLSPALRAPGHARANLRDTCQPRGPSRRALADKGVNVRNLSSAPSAHPLEATTPSLPAFLLLRVTRPGRRDPTSLDGAPRSERGHT